MVSAADILYYAVHPFQLRAITQWKVWHDPVHERDPKSESETLRKCFDHLSQTSRSFSTVIQELSPELLVPVTLFYLVLRGLDTIEDDMTIPLDRKDPLLREFYAVLDQDGWNFHENGPNEKDRGLLVEFEVVIAEFKKIKPEYQAIIKDITQRMGNGMADYAGNAEYNTHGLNTIKDYELYCHYVAGLVGDGLTRLFVEGKLANPALVNRPRLAESMGQFLQGTNIIRDIREDHDDKRRFWPKEIWSKHVENFEDLFKREYESAALDCSSEMVLNSLRRADECLFYMAGLREQSVFNFVAIPQTMAIATLELVFRNPKIFHQNVKITKGDACQLMMESSQNLQSVCEVFRRYARKIAKKNSPKDPNFLEISMACGKIEQFMESIFPSQVPPSVVEAAKEEETEEDKIAKKMEKEGTQEMIYVLLGVMCLLILCVFTMLGVAYWAGARFDLIWEEMKTSLFWSPPSVANESNSAPPQPEHGEL